MGSLAPGDAAGPLPSASSLGRHPPVGSKAPSSSARPHQAQTPLEGFARETRAPPGFKLTPKPFLPQHLGAAAPQSSPDPPPAARNWELLPPKQPAALTVPACDLFHQSLDRVLHIFPASLGGLEFFLPPPPLSPWHQLRFPCRAGEEGSGEKQPESDCNLHTFPGFWSRVSHQEGCKPQSVRPPKQKHMAAARLASQRR